MSDQCDPDAHAQLVEAGERLGLCPMPYETTVAFASRIAAHVELDLDQKKKQEEHILLAVRVGASLLLATFGITIF